MVFPNGARLRFGDLERDADADNYIGSSFARVYVEEIGTFPSPKPIFKLMSCPAFRRWRPGRVPRHRQPWRAPGTRG